MQHSSSKTNARASLGDSLVELCAGARRELLLVAPFIKQPTFERLLSKAPEVDLRCVTRWRPAEVAAGVSDLTVYEVVRERGGSLWLRNDLHAKYYRADKHVLVGSANLTATALGWSSTPNLELLVPLKADDTRASQFEDDLIAFCIPVTDDLYQHYRAAETAWKAALPTPPKHVSIESLEPSMADFCGWLPQTRQPADLYRVYRAVDADSLPSPMLQRATVDLAVLALPAGLTEPAFNSTVSAALLATTVHHGIDEFVATSRRFGEVRDFLAREHELDRQMAAEAWQTIIRWIKYFLPHRYRYQRPGHSEIIERRGL